MSQGRTQDWVDCSRAMATVCIVVTHVAASTLYRHGEVTRTDWWIANAWGSAARICVPVFLMLSGHLLLRSVDDVTVFLRKRAGKVLVPLIVWTVVYLAWNRYVEPRTDWSTHPLLGLLIHPAYYHLWFLYAILGIYLVVPLLRVTVAAASPALLRYYIALWVLAVAIVPLIEKSSGLRNNVDLLTVSGHAGYLVAGYLIGNMKIARRHALLAGMAFIAGVAATAIATGWVTDRTGVFNDSFYSYKSPNVMLASCAFVVVVRYLVTDAFAARHPWLHALWRSLSLASLGIYLVHVIVLDLSRSALTRYVQDPRQADVAWSIPAVTSIVVVLSWVVTVLLQRIPVVRRAVPS